MKKMLEETYLTIEQMGYGLIDPILAHWEPPAIKEKDDPDLSNPASHGQYGPVLFDDLWLEQYEKYAEILLNRYQKADKWQSVFSDLEDFIDMEGIWAEKVAETATAWPDELEKAIKHQDKQVKNQSLENLFSEFEGWPAKTMDILSPVDPDTEKTGNNVIELPFKINVQSNRLILKGNIAEMIKAATYKHNPGLNLLLTQLTDNTDLHNIKASVVNGQLQIEISR